MNEDLIKQVAEIEYMLRDGVIMSEKEDVQMRLLCGLIINHIDDK